MKLRWKIYSTLALIGVFCLFFNVNSYFFLNFQIENAQKYKIQKIIEKNNQKIEIVAQNNLPKVQAFFYISENDWLLVVNNFQFSPEKLSENSLSVQTICENFCILKNGEEIFKIYFN